MMNSKEHPDQDSMMALEALMKIKSDNYTKSTEPQRRTQSVQQRVQVVCPTTRAPPQNFAHPLIPMQIMSIPPPRFNLPQIPQFQLIPKSYPVSPPSTEGRTEVKVAPSEEPRLATPPLNAETASMDPAVRQEKIEAALRSKPQRGRKRDNLSVEERLELTRTRNREHAKSTRVRKKARYEELVNKEAMYDELKRAQDLDEDRIATVATFIGCREKQLSIPSEECRRALMTTMHSSFSIDLPVVTGNGVYDNNLDAMSRMDKLEEAIRGRLAKKFGPAVMLGYHIVGGRDSIALNKAGVAIIELSVVGRNGHGKPFTALTALTKWTFAADSHKLTAMQWTTIADNIEDVSPSNAGLKLQRHYPSVVSLDPHTGGSEEHTRGVSPRSEESPGMSF